MKKAMKVGDVGDSCKARSENLVVCQEIVEVIIIVDRTFKLVERRTPTKRAKPLIDKAKRGF